MAQRASSSCATTPRVVPDSPPPLAVPADACQSQLVQVALLSPLPPENTPQASPVESLQALESASRSSNYETKSGLCCANGRSLHVSLLGKEGKQKGGFVKMNLSRVLSHLKGNNIGQRKEEK